MSDPLRDALEKAQAELKAERKAHAATREKFETELKQTRLGAADGLEGLTREHERQRAELATIRAQLAAKPTDPVAPATRATFAIVLLAALLMMGAAVYWSNMSWTSHPVATRVITPPSSPRAP